MLRKNGPEDIPPTRILLPLVSLSRLSKKVLLLRLPCLGVAVLRLRLAVLFHQELDHRRQLVDLFALLRQLGVHTFRASSEHFVQYDMFDDAKTDKLSKLNCAIDQIREHRLNQVDGRELEIIIKPEKLENLKRILDSEGANGVMIQNIFGYGKQKGVRQVYTRDENVGVNLLPKLSVRTIVKDEIVDNIIKKVLAELNTGSFGDGKIFIKDIENAVKIRTGEMGDDALE